MSVGDPKATTAERTTPDFQALFEAAPGLYLVLTPDLTIVGASDAYCRATMTERAAIVGRKLFEVFPDNPDDSNATGESNLRSSLNRVRRDRVADAMAVQKYDIRRPESEGGGFEERYWSPVNLPVAGPGDTLRYILHRVEDVTEFVRLKRHGREQSRAADELRHKAGQMEAEILVRSQQLQDANQLLRTTNQALEERNLDLARASRAKSDFLAMMSHELRTPLNSIIGFSEVLSDETFGPLNERQARYVKNVLGSGRHLLWLINDILDFAKVEAGHLEVVTQPCDLPGIAREVVATLQPLADRRQLALGLGDALSHAVPQAAADPIRFKQLLYNLVSNAIKFTPAGGRVTITFESDPERASVRTTVADTGAGIDPADLGRLFKPFTQLANSTHGGTGLGLALTKQLVELMGGQIGVDSTVGSGSRFFVELPAVQDVSPEDPTPLAPGAPRPSGPAPLVLVVDDDPGSRELIGLALETGGYRTLFAQSGQEAIVLARRHRPHAITLDVELPDLDGWDILRILQSDEDLKQIPVIMVTVSSDRKAAFNLGAVAHLTKPISAARLWAILEPRIEGAAALRTTVRVLVIDDDQNQLELIRATLEPAGFAVTTESGARAGLAAASRSDFDVILLDLVMPEMSGVEVVAELRQHERTRQVPIILVTAHDLSADDHARLNGDVGAVLAKSSFDPAGFSDQIRRVLARLDSTFPEQSAPKSAAL